MLSSSRLNSSFQLVFTRQHDAAFRSARLAILLVLRGGSETGAGVAVGWSWKEAGLRWMAVEGERGRVGKEGGMILERQSHSCFIFWRRSSWFLRLRRVFSQLSSTALMNLRKSIRTSSLLPFQASKASIIIIQAQSENATATALLISSLATAFRKPVSLGQDNIVSDGIPVLISMLKAVVRLGGLGRFSTQKQRVVLFPGNGIGPEISRSVEDIFQALDVPVEFEHHEIHTKGQTEQGDLISNESIEAVRRYKFGLKGPFETPIGKGFRSLNVTLRKRLNLFANVRPCKSIEGVDTPYRNVDLVTIRENTEGEYSGLEHEVSPGVVENLKIISRTACENITKYAFEYAVANGRKSIVACHKAGVMKMGDGLFITTAKQVSSNYPTIEYWEEQIDTVCMHLANKPNEFDVMVMPNLYGDIVSDLCAGLIGGLGLTASGNIGFDCEVYEAVHGTAPDIAGQNKANPTALLLSATMMLKSMKLGKYATSIENSVFKVMRERKHLTGDLGGKAKTTEYTKAVIDNLII